MSRQPPLNEFRGRRAPAADHAPQFAPQPRRRRVPPSPSPARRHAAAAMVRAAGNFVALLAVMAATAGGAAAQVPPMVQNDAFSTVDDTPYTGNLLANDPDAAQVTVTGYSAGSALGSAPTPAGEAVAGDWGSLTVAGNGAFTYTPNAAALALDVNDSVTDTFTYLVSAGSAEATARLDMTVDGANQPPTFAVAIADGSVGTRNAADEVDLSANGAMTDYADADGDDQGFGAGATLQARAGSTGDWDADGEVAGVYGTLRYGAGGTADAWTYTLAADGPAYRALAEGSRTFDEFSFRADDGSGLADERRYSTVTVSLRIDVHVTPAAPQVAEASGADKSVTESGGQANTPAGDDYSALAASGRFTYNDGARTFGADGYLQAAIGTGGLLPLIYSEGTATLTGTYGTLSTFADGRWRYALNDGDSDTQGLNDAPPRNGTDVFSIRIRESNPAGTRYSNVLRLRIAVTGANDWPTAVPDMVAVTANLHGGYAPVMGNLLANDRDVDNRVPGELSVLRVTAAAGAAGPAGTTLPGTYGSLLVEGNGEFIYTYNGGADFSAAESVTDSFSYFIADQEAGTAIPPAAVTVTIAAPGPVLEEVAMPKADKSVAEAGGAVAGDPLAAGAFAYNGGEREFPVDGYLEVTPGVAVGANAWVAVANAGTQSAVTGTYGSLALAADGTWTYTLDDEDSDTQSLNAGSGQGGTEVFSFRIVEDSDSGVRYSNVLRLDIAVAGADDEPMARDDGMTVSEDDETATVNVLTGEGSTVIDGGDQDPDSALQVSRYQIGYNLNDGQATPAGQELTGAYGTLKILPDGSATYVPGAEAQTLRDQPAQEIFSYEIDGDGRKSTAVLLVTVTGANDPPELRDDNFSVLTGAASELFNVLANDSDVDGTLYLRSMTANGVTVVLSPAGPDDLRTDTLTGTHGTLEVQSDGWVTYRPGGLPRAATVEVIATDMFLAGVAEYGLPEVYESQLAVALSQVNQAPVAEDDLVEVHYRDGYAAFQVTDNDSDPENDDFAVSAYGKGAAVDVMPPNEVKGDYGTLTIDAATGEAVYTLGEAARALAPDSVVNDDFSYQIQEIGGTATATASLQVRVSSANSEPVAVDDELLLFATDAGGTVDVIVGVDGAGEDRDANGGDTLTVRGYVTGASYDKDTATAPPATLMGTYGTLTITAAGLASYTVAEPSAQLGLGATEAIADIFSYQMGDGDLGDPSRLTDTATLTVAIAGVNDPPAFSGSIPDLAMDEDASLSALGFSSTGYFSDIDTRDVLSYTAAITSTMGLDGSWLDVDSASGDFSGVPRNQHVGSYQVVVTATDPSGSEAKSNAFAVTVNNVNDPPMIIAQVGRQLAGTKLPYLLDLNRYVIDGDRDDVVRLSVVENVSWLEFDAATGILSGMPEAGDETAADSPHVIGVVATDLAGEAVGFQFELAVLNYIQQSAPPFMPTVLFVNEDDGELRGSVLGEAGVDTPGTLVRFAKGADIAVAPAEPGGSIAGDYGTLAMEGDGSFVYTLNEKVQALPATGSAADVFTYEILVGTGLDSIRLPTIVTISISGANDGPVAAKAVTDQTAFSGVEYRLAISAEGIFADVDVGDALTLFARGRGAGNLPPWLALEKGEAGYVLRGTPAAAAVAASPYRIVLSAVDPGGGVAQASFNLTVSQGNRAPMIDRGLSDVVVRALLGGEVAVPEDAFMDPDGDTLTYAFATDVDIGAWMTADDTGAALELMPPREAAGSVIRVTVTASDGRGGSVAEGFRLLIGDANNEPVAIIGLPDAVAYAGLPFRWRLPSGVFFDGDLDTLSYGAMAANGGRLPEWLSFTDGRLRGTPPADSSGRLGIILVAADGLGGTDQVAMDIVVRPALGELVAAVIWDEELRVRLPYVNLRLGPSRNSRPCIGFDLVAPFGDVSQWQVDADTLATPDCSHPDSPATAFLDDDHVLHVPRARVLAGREDFCMDLRFQFVSFEQVSLISLAGRACPRD